MRIEFDFNSSLIEGKIKLEFVVSISQHFLSTRKGLLATPILSL